FLNTNPLDDHHPKAEGNKERNHEDRRHYWRPKQESKAGLALPFNPHCLPHKHSSKSE
ncbi:unnamed protein product, partial [Musa textilis]